MGKWDTSSFKKPKQQMQKDLERESPREGCRNYRCQPGACAVLKLASLGVASEYYHGMHINYPGGLNISPQILYPPPRTPPQEASRSQRPGSTENGPGPEAEPQMGFRQKEDISGKAGAIREESGCQEMMQQAQIS